MACNWGYGQRGSFSVEFALVALVIGLLLAFSSEFIARQNMQGQVAAVKFFGVSLLKERSQFYQQSGELEEDQVLQLLLILRQSLRALMQGLMSIPWVFRLSRATGYQSNRRDSSLFSTWDRLPTGQTTQTDAATVCGRCTFPGCQSVSGDPLLSGEEFVSPSVWCGSGFEVSSIMPGR